MTGIGRRTALVVAIAAAVGLAAGIPLGALLFDGGDSQARRSGSLVVVGPKVLSTTCSKQQYQFSSSTALVMTSAHSRFRLPGRGVVQARMSFYRNGALLHVEDWATAEYVDAEAAYSHGNTVAHQSGESPDRAKVEWRVGKDVYPMFAAC